MAVSEATLSLLITLKDQASKGLDSLGSALSTVGGIAGGAALAGIGALAVGIKGGVDDAMGARALYASTEQTIKTMGNAAGVTADHVVEMASALSDAAGKSLFGDDQIQASTNLLLTFGEIKGATLDAATALTVDLAQALGGAPQDQAMMLGKALNDPIKGLTALGKAGLTFSQEQETMIKEMISAGDMAGAQALIIAELNKQVGGQGEAAAKAAGGMVQFKARLGETFETISTRLLPILDQFGAWLNDPQTQNAITVFADNLANGITTAAAWITGTLIPALSQVWSYFQANVLPILMEVATWLQDNIPPAIATVASFLTGTLIPALSQVWSFLQANVIPVLSALWTMFSDLFATVQEGQLDFDNLSSVLREVLPPELADGIANLVNWFQENLPPALAATSSFLTGTLIPAFNDLWTYVQTKVIPIVMEVVGWLKDNIPPAIQTVAQFVIGTLIPAFMQAWTYFKVYILPVLEQVAMWIRDNLPGAIEKVSTFVKDTLIPALSDLWSFIETNVIPALSSIATWLGETIPPIIEKSIDGWGRIKQALGDFKTEYIDPIVRGWDEVSKAITAATNHVEDVQEAIARVQIPGWLQGHSPPPLANWFSSIAGAAEGASAAVRLVAPALGASGGVAGWGDSAGAIPSSGASWGASGGTVINGAITIIVQGSADIQKTAIAVRDELNRIARRNVSNGLT